jgi:hypothetical protein
MDHKTLKTMKLKKGMTLVFAEGKRAEKILKASNDPIKGMIVTEANKYSTHFVQTWMRWGICRAFNKNEVTV